MNLARALLLLLGGAFLAGSLRAQPAFTVSRNAHNFGTVAVFESATTTFQIDARAALNFVLFSNNAPIFAVSPAFVMAAPGQPVNFTVTFNPNAVGNHTGRVEVLGYFETGVEAGVVPINVSGVGSPVFSTSLTSLSFGNVVAGCAAPLTFTVIPDTALDFTLDATDAAFTVSPSRFSGIIAVTVTVSFRPTQPGVISGFINVNASRGGTLAQTNRIAVTGTGADIVATPAQMDFGSIRIGASSAPQTVRLRTNPTIPASFQYSSASSNPAFRASAVSAAGDSDITFAPLAEGLVRGFLTYTLTRQDAGAGSCVVTRSVAASGIGVAVDIMVSPAAIDFGSVDLGTSSPGRAVTVTNRSTIEFTGTAASGLAAFQVTPAAFRLSPGASQTFNAAFRPAAVGAASSAISFTLDSVGTVAAPLRITLTVALAGQGLAPPAVTISPDMLAFGDVAVGSSVSRGVTVSNAGDAPVSISATTSLASFSVSPASFTLASRASQLVNVRFAPTAESAVQASASFAFSGLTRTVALSGRGIIPSLSYLFTVGTASTPVAPGGVVAMPPAAVGSSSSVQFRINNTGTIASAINSIISSDPVVALSGLPSFPATVPPGGSLSFTITFRPTALGDAGAVVSIDGQNFTARGTGVIAGAAITGLGATLPPAQQSSVGLTISTPYPAPIMGELTITSAPNDPAILFAGGGRTVTFSLRANMTEAMFAGGSTQAVFQNGTVAGALSLRASFRLGTTDITPLAAPVAAGMVPASVPVINSVRIAQRSATSFTLEITAFSTTRDNAGAAFALTPAPGANLQTTAISLDVGTLFRTWFQDAASAVFGSLFTLSVPFTVQPDSSAIRSVSVTLTNSVGASQARSVDF